MAVIRFEQQEGYKDWLKNTNSSWRHDASIQASTDENPFIYLTNTGEDDAIFQVALSKLINIQLSGENSVLVASSIFDKAKGIKVELRDQSQNVLATSKPSLNSKTWTYLLADVENISSDTTELWITFVLPAGASTIISAIYGQITTQSQVAEVWENISTILIVDDNETVQQVLDKIEDASEEKKYLVLVPSGHENEYFDWKPYVDVKFLDNLEERWQLDELEGWDDLSNWAIGGGFQKEVVTDWEGNQIKLTIQDGYRGMYFKDNLDLRKYQGILFRFKFPVTNINTPTYITMELEFIGTNAGHIKLASWSSMGVGSYDRYLFLPFNVDSYNLDYVDLSKLDWSSVRLNFMVGNASNGDELYLSDFKLVRTFPYPCILLRTDDSYINNFRINALKEFVKQKIPAMWAIIADEINQVTNNNNQLPSPELLHELQQTGLINIVNHSYSHPNFKETGDKDTLFQVESSRFIFERLGLKDALRWWVNPYASTNPLLEKTLKEFGYMSVYSHHSGIPIASNLAYPYVPDNFQPLKKGGIVTLLFHATEVDTEEHFNELMDKVNNLKQFCRFVSLKDIEKLMNNSHEGFSPRQTKPTLHKVLDSNFDMYFYHKQLFLDPNGTDRDINVQTYKLRPGDTFLIVNIGTSGNLVFDPSGANIAINPSSSIKVVYTGEGWVQI